MLHLACVISQRVTKKPCWGECNSLSWVVAAATSHDINTSNSCLPADHTHQWLTCCGGMCNTAGNCSVLTQRGLLAQCYRCLLHCRAVNRVKAIADLWWQQQQQQQQSLQPAASDIVRQCTPDSLLLAVEGGVLQRDGGDLYCFAWAAAQLAGGGAKQTAGTWILTWS